MANKQTKAYRKLGLATHNGGATIGSITEFEIFQGSPCNTHFESREKNPQNKRKSAWKGCKKNPVAAKLAD